MEIKDIWNRIYKHYIEYDLKLIQKKYPHYKIGRCTYGNPKIFTGMILLQL